MYYALMRLDRSGLLETNDMKKSITAELVNSPRYSTIRGAAQYCGLCERSISRMIAARKLTAFRPVGGRTLVDLKELENLIQSTAGKAGKRTTDAARAAASA
jgi:hypothetical protein